MGRLAIVEIAARPAGATLIELLILVAVIAVLSGAAISLLSGGQAQNAAEEAAHRLAADMAFTQADAMASQSPRRMLFDPATERYSVRSESTTLTHPVSKKPFTVDLAALFHGTSVDLVATTFGGDSLRFAPSGAPSSGGCVTLSASGAIWVVTVGAGTGRITLTH